MKYVLKESIRTRTRINITGLIIKYLRLCSVSLGPKPNGEASIAITLFIP